MKIAVLGYGTVGSGVVEVLEKNRELIAARAGEPIEVKYVLDLRDFPGDPIQEKVVHDYGVILRDPEIGVVTEVMGGVEPANTFAEQALTAGKSVVTSNKALVAKHGARLMRIAAAHGVNFLFEASVGGGIPILRTLGSCLTADEILEITGILNGTTNYMLTKMFYEGADYDKVLKEAQANGYAEADPTADVEGQDACRKIAILSSIISGRQVDFETIYMEGITGVSAADMRYARELGMTVKLLAQCRKQEDRLSCFVAPCLLPAGHPLYGVDDVFNAVLVKGNMLGDAMFYGSGAGKLPTASAVAADVIAAVKHPGIEQMNRWSEEKLTPEDIKDSRRRFLVRMPGKMEEQREKIRSAFGEVPFLAPQGLEGEFGFTTPQLTEGSFYEKLGTCGPALHILRIEE